MIKTDIAVVGGGPAGLSAALTAAELGAQVLLVEQHDELGGQLVKQTHMFFGSERQHAGIRGIDIAKLLVQQAVQHPRVEIMTRTVALGYYPDGVLAVERNDSDFLKIHPKRLIAATGAAERMLAFPNNDLPGVYGAGAVQTLMNVYGVRPGERVLMVGAGNIGLIVSYQLLQAGVDVAAILDAAPKIGGYLVHAAKVRRMGVPILTSHTIIEALGEEQVEGAVIAKLDESWQVIPGTEQRLQVDTICLAVGLTPLTELLWQAGCRTSYVPELGGHVAIRNENLETTVKGIYVAGDLAGVEEASSAMVEGRLAGASAAESLGYAPDQAHKIKLQAQRELEQLRSGPMGEKIRTGLKKLQEVQCLC